MVFWVSLAGARRHLQADVAVDVVGAIVDRAQDIRGHLDVPNGELLEDSGGVGYALAYQPANGLVVVATPVDRFLEDGGIGGDADNGVLIDAVAAAPPT